MHHRDALYWACLYESEKAVAQIAAKMRDSSDWPSRCSLAFHAVLIATNPGKLVDILLGGYPEAQEMVNTDTADRNGWILKHCVEIKGITTGLPLWLEQRIKELDDETYLIGDRGRGPKCNQFSDEGYSGLPMDLSGWDTLEKEYPLDVSMDGLTVSAGSGLVPNNED